MKYVKRVELNIKIASGVLNMQEYMQDEWCLEYARVYAR